MHTNKRRLIALLLFLSIAVLIINTVDLERNTGARNQECRDCNVILIAIDTLRADHLGVFGYSRNTSPNIDAFAQDARIFENFYSNAPWTLPSFSTMFTSLYPRDSRMQLPSDRLDDKFTTIAEILQQNGYTTVGFNSPSPLSEEQGFFQGFDSFTVVEPDGRKQDTTLIVPKALDWLNTNKNTKFFMFLHTFEVHDPFCPPGDFDKFRDNYSGTLDCIDITTISEHNRGEEVLSSPDLERLVSLYDGDILHTDYNLGKLFDQLKAEGLYGNTIVIVTADHGEEFGERELIGHAYALHSELVHVPLLIRAPNFSPGIEHSSASTIDISPTILDLLGIPIPSYFKGRPLTQFDGSRIIYQETSAPIELVRQLDRIIASTQQGQIEVRQSDLPAYKESMIYSNWKYIVDSANSRTELYDLNSDPREERNLIGINQPQEQTLKDLYISFRRNEGANTATAAPVQLTPP